MCVKNAQNFVFKSYLSINIVSFCVRKVYFSLKSGLINLLWINKIPSIHSQECKTQRETTQSHFHSHFPTQVGGNQRTWRRTKLYTERPKLDVGLSWIWTQGLLIRNLKKSYVDCLSVIECWKSFVYFQGPSAAAVWFSFTGPISIAVTSHFTTGKMFNIQYSLIYRLIKMSLNQFKTRQFFS